VAWIQFIFTIFLASALCALFIGWGLNLLGFVPFSVLGNIILFNNFVSSMLFAPLLLSVLYPRVARGRLLYHHLIEPRPARPRVLRLTGLGLLAGATISGFIVGNLLSSGQWTPELFVQMGWVTQTRSLEIGLGLLPFICLACIGLALL
jgi:energy-coupling factor transport system substrate-specific component